MDLSLIVFINLKYLDVLNINEPSVKAYITFVVNLLYSLYVQMDGCVILCVCVCV